MLAFTAAAEGSCHFLAVQNRMSKQPWALILGASSGFGEATALELARTGMHIIGIHLDRRQNLPHVEEIQQKIRALGREVEFFNTNASDDEMRQRTVEQIRQRLASPPGVLRVLMHSLAFGALKPLAGAEEVVSKKQIEITADTMGHSLVYWVQDCLRAGLFDWGGRIFAMTSAGSTRAIPNYGPVSAAKAIIEAHIRQLAVELAPAGITANAILAGVTETPALRLIPGHEKLMDIARQRNPHRRLTVPEDVARCIAALCHPATYWMTGNTIHVDGGENIVG
jgi:NAD(P)-dependent dehydrogenase (short-subunit alcohol dehydrogenase family)